MPLVRERNDSDCATGTADDKPGLKSPLYRSASGAVGADPLALTDAVQVSRAKLARFLVNPVLEMNVGAPCPWESVERLRPILDFSTVEGSDPSLLGEEFAGAVTRAIGSAETVVVLYSGGLDSFAVMVEVARQCTATGRRVVPVVWDLVDQTGRDAAAAASAQLAALPECPRPTVIPVQWRDLPEPEWSPLGPRDDCHGRLRRRTEEFAAALPDPVIVTGSGGDEVFAAWNFGTRSLLAGQRFRDLARYWGAFVRHETLMEVVGELASLGHRWWGRARSFQAYLAFGWRQMLSVDPGEVVHPELAAAVEAAHERWLRQRFEIYCAQQQDWAQAMFFDQVYPFAYDHAPLDSLVPERSPYVDVRLLRYAAGLPWRERFDATARSPYHWYKALQRRLIPSGLHRLVPTYKSHYGREYERYLDELAPSEPLALRESGVLGAVRYDGLRLRHGYLPLVTRNVELWLRGALARGYMVTD